MTAEVVGSILTNVDNERDDVELSGFSAQQEHEPQPENFVEVAVLYEVCLYTCVCGHVRIGVCVWVGRMYKK